MGATADGITAAELQTKMEELMQQSFSVTLTAAQRDAATSEASKQNQSAQQARQI